MIAKKMFIPKKKMFIKCSGEVFVTNFIRVYYILKTKISERMALMDIIIKKRKKDAVELF